VRRGRGRQGETKACSARGVVSSPQAPTMRFDDGAADAKLHAGTVRLGGKEGVEDLVRLLPGKPLCRSITDRDQKPSSIAPSARGFPTPSATPRLYCLLAAHTVGCRTSQGHRLLARALTETCDSFISVGGVDLGGLRSPRCPSPRYEGE
jgi:hypothetical protein